MRAVLKASPSQRQDVRCARLVYYISWCQVSKLISIIVIATSIITYYYYIT